MKRIFTCLLLLLPLIGWSQETRVIKGKVLSKDNGLPLPGVSIYVDNSTIGVEYGKGVVSNYNLGTVSDIEGNFSIELPKIITKLTFSMIGFDNQLLELTGASFYSVDMSETMSELDEVVITGYQEIKNRKVTAAISKIDAADIKQNTIASVDNMLAGQLVGVQTTATSGAPGAPAKIRIRGTASLQGTQEPLWVLDGMPLTNTDLPSMDGRDVDQLVNTSIAGINPSDIENITVLKDAAATAIYGTRAANGVILITTKKGKEGRMRVDATTNWFVNVKPDMSRLNLLNSDQKVNLELDLAKRSDLTYRNNKGAVARILNDLGEFTKYQNGGFSALSADTQAKINQLRQMNTNWGDELYHSALSQNHSISISGGNDKANYYFSAGYYNEDGTTIGTSMTRTNFTLKTDLKLTSKLTFGVSIFGNNRKQKSYLTGTDSFTNPGRYSRTANPYLRVNDEEGAYVYDPEIDGYSGRYIDYNIVEERNGTTNKQNVYSTTTVFDLNYNILDGLRLKSQFGLTVDKADSEKTAQEETYFTRKLREKSRRYVGGKYVYYLPDGGVIDNLNETNNQWNWKNMLYFSKSFNSIHDIDLMAGSEMRRTKNERIRSIGYGYDADDLTTTPIVLPSAEHGKTFSSYGKTFVENAYISFFGTANYTFKEKYSVFTSIRYDGSDLFGVDPKYKYLPLYSLGGAWNINEEGWLKNVHWLTFLKLRTSYGLQGNIDKSTSPYVVGEHKHASILPGDSEKTIVVSNPPNNKLRWEKTSTWNAGIDLGIFKNRLRTNVDLYHRRSVDLIAPQAIALENGFSTTNTNFAEMTNKGIEITLTAKVINNSSFGWTASFNMAKNINKIEKLNVQTNGVQPSKEGHSINSLFALPTNGLDKDGYPMFVKDGKNMSVKEFFGLYSTTEQWLKDFGFPDVPATNLKNEDIRRLYKKIGSTDPKWSGGISNRFRYKNWSLNVSANFHLKQWMKQTPFYSMTEFDRGVNTTTAINNIWTPNNKSGKYPAIVGQDSYNKTRQLAYGWMTGTGWPINAFNDLDIWYKEVSYIRINSIRLGYKVPQIFCKKLGIASARINAEARNPFVFGTDYDGYFDPETYGNIYSQPIAKSFMVGLNLSF